MGQATLEMLDAAGCRRLAELLQLDAVGVVRADGDRRRVDWWAAPDVTAVPLERIVEGRAPDWISCPSGDGVVFAHRTEGSQVRSVSTLTAMLASLATDASLTTSEASADPANEIARERTRLAYAIHDGLTQVVTASVLELEWQARRVDVSPEDAVGALTTAADELRKALDEIRSILAALSPPDGTAERSLDQLVQDVIERWQLPATWTVEGDLHAVPTPVLEVASSVIREGVANAAKHAASSEVAVAVSATAGAVEVRVEDHGKGFAAAASAHAGHLGLEMMRRRVAEVQGTLEIESSPGAGTRVVARLPLIGEGVTP
jgi:signal transduction histidine kinase